ncbi:ATP-binding protein [Corallincola platygyrae]|uniref:histidine kinase n=1 Tax=Corallincola platygyrae TaxID=1193278 RepID=A0ABW4XHY2_9GAMM
MKLKRQLMAASLFMLALPWAGCQYVREAESALRAGQLQSLEATGQAINSLLAQQEWGLVTKASTDGAEPLFAPERPWIAILDGYLDEWQSMPARRLENGEFAADLRMFTRGDKLYLHVSVEDSERSYFDPMRGIANNGDHIVLRSGNGIDYRLAASAPGQLIARYQSGNRTLYEREIAGYWLETQQGYHLEAVVPLALLKGKLGLYAVNASAIASDNAYLSHYNFSDQQPPRLITTRVDLERTLALFQQPSLKLSVIDSQGWHRASVGELASYQYGPARTTTSHGALKALYRAILETPPAPPSNSSQLFGQEKTAPILAAINGQTAAGWYRQPHSSERSLVSAAIPIKKQVVSAQNGSGELKSDDVQYGVLLLEQSSESYLSLTDRAFSKLFLSSTIALLIGAAGLFGYVSWLSWRIRRLNRSTQSAVDHQGNFSSTFKPSRTSDEIGDLSRGFGELLNRVQQYTNYLQTLSRKLSHELRTPLAVVHSSLDNLSMSNGDKQEREMYQKRAKEGANRLSSLLTAMSEASRLEESIKHGDQEIEAIDLNLMFREVIAAYKDVYTQHNLMLSECEQPLVANIAPELLVQLTDKLVDNAASFAPEGSDIKIRLSRNSNKVELRIENTGPRLPEAMQHQLFDNMVSVREKEKSDGGSHLGLGLHIVKLIADFHGAAVTANNLEDGSGVAFTLVIPIDDNKHA